MATAQQDTEITLGTGRMLAIFFTLVLICAFFFAIGFSLGRKTAMAVASGAPGVFAGTPATVVRPSAAKNIATQPTPQPAAATDFSFYKAVGAKSADSGLTPQDSAAQNSGQNSSQNSRTQASPSTAAPATAAASTEAPANAVADATSAAAAGLGYFVQVAAVSRQEDADALVEALKKKQYPAFAVNNASADKFYHVQVGPYTEVKDAEAMRARLIGDGYNPIVKK